MTTKEFSDAFDTLLNSYNVPLTAGATPSIGGMVLDEYEKSLFLTQAQDQIVTELYTGRSNKVSSFEETEELRSNLRSLIKTTKLEESTKDLKGISENSKFFDLPKDLLFITYEFATISDTNSGCKNGSEILITPVTQDEFNKVINNPFKGTSKRRALRLDSDSNTIEVVSKYNIKDYTIRYLSKPAPIILANFNESSIDNVSINGLNTKTECTLDSSVHHLILERAVALALASRSTRSNK